MKMKFHNWEGPLHLPNAKNTADLQRLIDTFQTQEYAKKQHPRERKMRIVMFGTHVAWRFDKRPYYSVYPKVVDALIRTPLTSKVRDLMYPTSTNTLCIRMAVGHELLGEIKTLFIANAGIVKDEEGNDTGNWVFLMLSHLLDDTCGMVLVSIDPEATLEEAMDTNNRNIVKVAKANAWFLDECSQDKYERHSKACMRLALGVALLDQDPELIVPAVLNVDQDKLDNTIDPERLAFLVDRAKRRGVVGWTVGECTEDDVEHEGREVSSHFRRTHYGFRWVGKGRERLRLTKIKGSVIHREKLTEVPTGYLDKEKLEDT